MRAQKSQHNLLARDLELVIGEDEVLLVLRLVAVETRFEIRSRVYGLVGIEDLIFPFAVARGVGIVASPARTLRHHPVAANVCRPDEAAVGVLDRIALCVELRSESNRGDDRVAGQGHALLGGLDCFSTGVVGSDLLALRTIDGHVDDAARIILRKDHLVGAGPDLDRRGEPCDYRNDGGNAEISAKCHGLLPIWSAGEILQRALHNVNDDPALRQSGVTSSARWALVGFAKWRMLDDS